MNFTLNLPQPWKVTFETGGAHAVCGLMEADVEYAAMPDDSTAQDQAFTNFLDMVGFDDDDPDDYNPLFECTFNNRKAYGFQAWADENRQIVVLCLEPKKGRLAVVSGIGPDAFQVIAQIEKGLRFI